MLSYAFQGILEHFEDDYDSESDDIEIDEYPKYSDDYDQFPNRDGTGLSHLSDFKDGFYNEKHTPAYNKLALKAMQKGITTTRPPQYNSKDPIFVSSQFTRQKVRVIGRDIVHKFKFNTVVKQDEATRIFTHRRDERLRKLNAEDEKKLAEGRLAIMSNKELYV